MAPVVISEVNGDTPAIGGIFNGLAFFLVQRLPSRSSYVSRIQANGGRVVKLEAQADHTVADHLRKDCPPGSVSYTFIDAALRDGIIPSPEDHVAGPAPGTVRDVGSTVVAGKGTRTPFTAEDDRVLWQWVARARSEGGSVKGNEIYKQLEARNPRHTFQAWRDRYIKKLMDNPPAGVEVTVPANAPPSPPHAPVEEGSAGRAVAHDSTDDKPRPNDSEGNDGKSAIKTGSANSKIPRASQASGKAKESTLEPVRRTGEGETSDIGEAWDGFGPTQFETLMEQASDIVGIAEDQADMAWEAWAKSDPTGTGHSADAWRNFWTEKVLPMYLKRRKERKRKRTSAVGVDVSTQKTAESSKRTRRASVVRKDNELDQQNTAPSSDGRKSSRSQDRATPPPLTSDSFRHVQPRQERVEVSTQVDDEAARRPSKSGQHLHSVSTQPIELLSDDEEEIENTVKSTVVARQETSKHSDNERQADSTNNGEHREAALSDSATHHAAELSLEQEAGSERLKDGGQAKAPISNSAEVYAAQQDDADEITPEDAADEYVDDAVVPPGLAEDKEVGSGVPDEESAVAGRSESALTEANLASQQAQHKAELRRGADLSEDDEMHDQSEFVTYLQSLTGQKAPINENGGPPEKNEEIALQQQTLAVTPSEGKTEPLNKHIPAAAEQDVRPPISPFSSFLELPPISPNLDISQQELDDMLEDSLQWPSTPQQKRSSVSARAKLASQAAQSHQFETQITHPSNVLRDDEANGAETLITPTMAQKEVQYPALPQTGELEGEGDIETGVYFSSQPSVVPDPHGNQRLFNGIPGSNDVSTAVDVVEIHNIAGPPLVEPAEESQEEIDLGLAEPEDGFSSPPARSANEDQEEIDLGLVELEDGFSAPSARSAKEEQAGIDLGLVAPDGGFSSPSARSTYEEQADVDLGLVEPEGGFSFPVARSAASPAQFQQYHGYDAGHARLETDRSSSSASSVASQAPPMHSGQSQEQVQLATQHKKYDRDARQPRDLVNISSGSSPSSPSGGSEIASQPEYDASNQHRPLETQDIIDAETQQPDLDMILPPNSDDEHDTEQHSVSFTEPSSLRDQPPAPEALPSAKSTVSGASHGRPSLRTPRHSTRQRKTHPPPKPTALTESQPIDSDDIDIWIATMTVKYNITDENTIVSALHMTSARAELAEIVLLELKAGKGIPGDLAGVWREDDDRVVESGDASGLRKLVTKHGWEEVEGRLRYLEEWRDG